ncbi:hypothetical protein [Aquitalea denitrificans]|uniref:hypothetical protein n=1 Tax=Aquitalea denitrificans TaxID=519081 RepID=UPI001358EBCB|nr:hypothetical protein [Aquitalea denitrificans]
MKRICHYTSFETLKLIIENKTIRFNSLKNVDDAEEGFTTDFGYLSPYFFASCWTYDCDEKLPLWAMYVKDRFAVRIEVDSDILKLSTNKYHQITNHVNGKSACYPIFRGGGNPVFLSRVDYRTEPLLSMTKNVRGMFSDDFIESFGTTKRSVWDFQNECRFLIQATPIAYANRRPSETPYTNHLESIWNKMKTDIENIDMLYDVNKLRTANFMLGPSTTPDDFEILKNYILAQVPEFNGEFTRSAALIRRK